MQLFGLLKGSLMKQSSFLPNQGPLSLASAIAHFFFRQGKIT
jgi:hypothetical protein